VLSGKQILHELITAPVNILMRAGEVIVDPHARRAAEIICDRKNFVSRFALAKQPLRIRASRADGEQFSRNSDKTRKQ